MKNKKIQTFPLYKIKMPRVCLKLRTLYIIQYCAYTRNIRLCTVSGYERRAGRATTLMLLSSQRIYTTSVRFVCDIVLLLKTDFFDSVSRKMLNNNKFIRS